LVFDVQRVADVSKDAELRRGLANFAGREVSGRGTDPKAVGLKQLRIFLLRDILGQGTAAHGGEQVREEELVEPWRFVTKIDPLRIAQCVVAVRQE
jgi:hypothetical protein